MLRKYFCVDTGREREKINRRKKVVKRRIKNGNTKRLFHSIFSYGATSPNKIFSPFNLSVNTKKKMVASILI